jgi:hypothetical protein
VLVKPVASRSWTKASKLMLKSAGNRFDALLSNATKRPPAEIDGYQLPPDASVPSVATLIRAVAPRSRSCTNRSYPFVSPATRFEAALWNATKRPSKESDGV